MTKLFNNFPSSQANLVTSSENLNDIIEEGSTITLDDLVCMFNRNEVELTDAQIEAYAKSGELPEDHYFVFKLIVANKDGKVTTKNSATYSIFNLDVKVGDEKVKLNDWAKHLNDENVYDADMELADDATIDFSKISDLHVKGFDDVFETRPTVIESREAMSNYFKEGSHFIIDKDGNKKHFKFASKDHDGSGSIIRKARAENQDIDYAKIAMLPVFRGAKQLRVPLVAVS